MTCLTIEKNQRPWMTCDPVGRHEAMDVARKCNLPMNSVNIRPATPDEISALIAERVLAAKEGRNPDAVFGVRL